MCGIIGYLGDPERTVDVLIDGLTRLEYRGYDSSGIAVASDGATSVVRSSGKLSNLVSRLEEDRPTGPAGIGHTRWATHGPSTEQNAHPHRSGSTVVVHNGIVENFLDLRHTLRAGGCDFGSDTDTEVIAHLIEQSLERGLGLEDAVREAFERLEGSNAIVVLSEREPGKMVGIKKFSPLVLAIGEGEFFFASDVSAVLHHTKDVIFLEDGEMATVQAGSYEVVGPEGGPPASAVTRLVWDPVQVEKGGFKHFMLKEIYEQPGAVLDTLSGRFDLERGEVMFEGLDPSLIEETQKIVMTACGTSYHACLIGKHLLERIARQPVEVELASELRYRDPIIGDGTLLVAVSQSGETADTSEALLMARARGARTLAITNVGTSKMAREADITLLTHAGPEIGVASTKAFTTQLVVLYLLAIWWGRGRGLVTAERATELITDALKLPKLIELTLKLDREVQGIARDFYKLDNFLYLGRGLTYPVALEGALKLKEISYIHAEGYPAGEMKHGPIALVDENMPVLIVAPGESSTFTKVLGNLEEISARGGRVILLTSGDVDERFQSTVERVIRMPAATEFTSPIISTVPLQLLAYHIAALKGTDIDQPRNLAKVVTVE